jgi:pimeloyl-ACP methyl ester carboxylesterase/class 3 adenylate cyclase
VQPPRVQYVWNDDVAIAYGVVGEGPIDLVYVQGFVSDVEMMWELPQAAAFFERLARWSRLITIDRRGVGMSDRYSRHDAPPLEDAAGDVLRVLDAVGSDRAALLGHNEGGQICAMLAATAPERVRSLTLFSTPISKRRQEIEEGADPDSLDRENTEWARRFGTTSFDQELFSSICPSYVADPDMFAFMLRFQRHAASPGAFTGVVDLLYHTDLTGILESIRVPTQVLHRTGDRLNPIGWSRRLAAAIPGAEFVELDGEDWWPFLGDADALLDEVERFVLGAPVGRPQERGLGTVVFTDIVDSTATAASMGDAPWRAILSQHNALATREIAAHGGRYVSSAGDGVLALFDGPARATRYAATFADSVRELGIEVRAGVHTGEIEHAGDDVAGLAVHIGARVGALAGPSEVLVSQTVRDLVAGSGLMFEDAGEHELKGVPDRWRLYRVVSA